MGCDNCINGYKGRTAIHEVLLINQDIRDAITGNLRKESFQRFNNDRLEVFDTKDVLKKANLYHPDHNEKQFLSIDLKKANFHALRYYDPEIVDHAETFEDWILQFTPSALT